MKNINSQSILSISILIFLMFIILIITLVFIKNNLSEKVKNPTVSLDKVFKEEDGEQLRYTKVEYEKNNNSDKKTIYEFKDEINEENEVEYFISYLSQKYLVITRCSSNNLCSETLLDLNSLQEIKSEFASNFGKYYFYEDEKYVIFEGLGRFAQPGISIEIIDGKKVNCIISEEEVLDISIKDGILYFAEELLLTEDISDPFIERYVDILDFCKE